MTHAFDAMSGDDFTLRIRWTADGHAPEEAFFAWLDGALDERESAALSAHVDACAACAASLAEARGVMAASLRILGEADGGQIARTPPTTVRASRSARAQGATTSPWWRVRGLAAAAAVVLLVGAAYLGTRQGVDGTRRLASTTPRVADGSRRTGAAAPRGGDDTAPVRIATTAPATGVAAGAPDSTPDRGISETRANASALPAAAPAPPAPRPPATSDVATAPRSRERPSPGDSTVAGLPVVRVEARAEENTSVAFTIGPQRISDTGATFIAGRVTDGERPLVGVQVGVPRTPLTVLTDSLGRYALAGVPRSASEIIARRIGFNARAVPLSERRPDSATIDFQLAASTQALATVVVQLDTTDAPPAFECLLVERDDVSGREPLVRALRGPLRAVGSHRLVVLGWPTPDAERPATFSMGADGWLRGSVIDSTRGGIARLVLELFDESAGWFGVLTETRGDSTRAVNAAFVATPLSRCARGG